MSGSVFSRFPFLSRSTTSFDISMGDSVLAVELSARARRALESMNSVVVELELRYQCMVRTLVHVHESVPEGRVVHWSDDGKLGVFYHAVIGQGACSFDSQGKRGDTDTQAVGKIPTTLRLDYKDSAWSGAFGFS